MRKLPIILLAFVGLLVIFLIATYWTMAASVAPLEGQIDLPGLDEKVEIYFDEKAIPQIFAQTDGGAFYAQGWLHASERLFQMEMVRRLSGGRLAEVFGSGLIEVDRSIRTMGFARRAAAGLAGLDQSTRKILQRYCDGINAYIEYRTILPPEFWFLRIEPEPWTVEQLATIAFYQTWYNHRLMDKDKTYREVIAKLGEEGFNAISSEAPWSPATVPGSPDVMMSSMLDGLQLSNGSNAWAVTGEKSASGAAMHASDPHLIINSVPAFWYINGLHSAEGLDVVGISAAGLPGVFMGHNQNIAYSFTVAPLDIVDTYRFRRVPGDSLKVYDINGTSELKRVTEAIEVRGSAEPEQVEVLEHALGPVIFRNKAEVHVRKWAGFDFPVSSMLASAVKLQKAADFSTFQKLVTNFGSLNVNWIYSDRNDNIGYQLGAPIPVRTYRNTFALLDGENPDLRWQGYFPLEATPQAYNPQRNWLVTCNNQVEAGKAGAMPGFYDLYRIGIAEEYFHGPGKMTRQDFYAMQMDERSGIALRWKGLMAEGALNLGQPDLATQIIDWNGAMSADSEIAALFARWWQLLPLPLFEDELQEDWRSGRHFQESVLSKNVLSLIDDNRTPDRRETTLEIAAAALKEVQERYSPASYGDISSLRVQHLLSREPILDKLLDLSRGPLPAPGDPGSLNANFNNFDLENGRFSAGAGPSMRFLMDWKTPDAFTIHINLGQSGNPFSPHYDDFFEMNRRGDRWTVPFSREKVEEQSKSTLVLQ